MILFRCLINITIKKQTKGGRLNMNVPEKAYTISFDEKPEYLYAHVKCDSFSVEIAFDYLRDVFAECRELQYTKILIKREIPYILSPEENLTVAKKLAEMDIKELKIAIADPRLANREANKLSADASRGLGIRVRVYSTVPEARRWLLYE